VVFTKQFKALAGWRLALMNEGINALFSTCHRLLSVFAAVMRKAVLLRLGQHIGSEGLDDPGQRDDAGLDGVPAESDPKKMRPHSREYEERRVAFWRGS
jgi:hypothetical protein